MRTNKLLSTLCALAVGLGTVAAGTVSAGAAPLNLPRIEAPDSNVTTVGHRSGFYRSGGGIYFNGHRGYRGPRPGYRHHNGFWFPPAAFALGAIVGGALAAPPPPRYYYRDYYRGPVYRDYYDRPAYRAPVASSHVRWCHSRYRSYRAWDNTWQPYHGPRRQCWSPYS